MGYNENKPWRQQQLLNFLRRLLGEHYQQPNSNSWSSDDLNTSGGYDGVNRDFLQGLRYDKSNFEPFDSRNISQEKWSDWELLFKYPRMMEKFGFTTGFDQFDELIERGLELERKAQVHRRLGLDIKVSVDHRLIRSCRPDRRLRRLEEGTAIQIVHKVVCCEKHASVTIESTADVNVNPDGKCVTVEHKLTTTTSDVSVTDQNSVTRSI